MVGPLVGLEARATVGLTALRRRSGATEAAHQSHRSDKIQKTFTFFLYFEKHGIDFFGYWVV